MGLIAMSESYQQHERRKASVGHSNECSFGAVLKTDVW